MWSGHMEEGQIVPRLQLLQKPCIRKNLEELDVSFVIDDLWVSRTNKLGSALASLRKLRRLKLRIEYSNPFHLSEPRTDTTTTISPWSLPRLANLDIKVQIDRSIDLLVDLLLPRDSTADQHVGDHPTILTIVASLLPPDDTQPYIVIVPELL